MILAIDPGTTDSAFVVLPLPDCDFEVLDKGKVPNDKLLQFIQATKWWPLNHFVIEMVASYGMAVGKTTFETVFWTGRFWEAANYAHTRDRLYRKADICMHLCQSTRAKDANIRQVLIDRFGEPGTKLNPGVLYGVSKDIWSALAVGVTYRDYQNAKDIRREPDPSMVQ
jgi:hypothetical protein